LIGAFGLAVLSLITPTADAAKHDFDKVNTVKIGVIGAIQIPTGQGIVNAAKMAADEQSKTASSG
jgi:hypothetical protein